MSLLATFSAALEARDPYLRGHSFRVTTFAEGLARTIGWEAERIETLRLGGALHDVGKIAVDASVLRKPGPLNAEELAQVRTHPSAGARLIDGVADFRPALPPTITSAGTGPDIPRGGPARRSRRRPACWGSPTRSTQ